MKQTRLRGLALASLASLALAVTRATTLVEDFSADPLANGWNIHGNASLFAWNSTDQNLAVTWDSAQPNSYFHRGLGLILSKTNDFMLAFDLRLTDITGGVYPNKPFPFQIALGLMNPAQATNSSFVRGSGYESPNLVEFDYFPGAIFDPTVSPVIISANNEFNDGGFTFPLELTPGALFHVTMLYTAEDGTLRTFMLRDGLPFGPVKDATLGAGFSDFIVTDVSISSYSDAGQFPGFEGSVLAHGTVDNLVVAAPPPVTKSAALPEPGGMRVQFLSTTNWNYRLQRTTDFQSWSTACGSQPGTGGPMVLQDTNPPAAGAFYRVEAQLP